VTLPREGRRGLECTPREAPLKDGHDRDLGMDRAITRRDFLNGCALGAAGIVGLPRILAAQGKAGDAAYPPALTGLRGSHPGSFETAHALRDGAAFWKEVGAAVGTGETYDLVVVGGGISGLSAAYFFRKAAGPGARILVLDNHDDFGGHAKRNEFREGDRLLLGYGGTFAIESPAPYSATAKGLIAELGIDVARGGKVLDRTLYRSLGLQPSFFFDKETFGTDRLLPDPAREQGGESPEGRDADSRVFSRFMTEAPLSERAKRGIAALLQAPKDPFPGLTSDAKKERLARISYGDFLTTLMGLDPTAIPFFQARPHPLYGVGIDAVSAQDAWGLGFPGFQKMGLEPKPGPGMGLDAIQHKEADDYFFHFPDGNASIARLLVRALIPKALPGSTADDLVTSRALYDRLDEAAAPVRIRLGSTAVRVRHLGSQEVEVGYVRGGTLRTVQAKQCVLACWNAVIPYICPELPEAQKDALASAAKVPLVYTNVLIRNWTSFVKVGTNAVHAPGCYHTGFNLDLPVSMGAYRCSRSPEEPIIVHMMRTPCLPGEPARTQHRAGRAELFGTTFETFERQIREQLARTVGPGGFDPARDIRAITVNRWPHGYAYQYNSLWDPFWLKGGTAPCIIGRKRFGRIAIANADAAAYAYTDAAIDQAHRAVSELLGKA
jgi:spermidine dehydrogenase